jgi:hypothetical protein
MCLVVIAWSTSAKGCIYRQLHHDRSHHLVVFMPQNVAVIHVPRKFSQLIVRNVEVIIISSILFSELRFGPSDTIVQSFECLYERSIFPTSVVRLTRGMAFIFDVNECLSVIIFLI